MGRTDTSTDFAGGAEEDVEEDSGLEGPQTRWSPRVLAKESAYIKTLYGTSMIAWKEKHHGEGPVFIQKDKLKGK